MSPGGPPVVCATRGGPGSRACQLRAIERAADTGAPLVFVHVVDVEAFGPVDERMRAAVAAELAWVGRALLNIALQRSQAMRVDAEGLLTTGETWAQIARVAGELRAAVVLVGCGAEADPAGSDQAGSERAAGAAQPPRRLADALARHGIAIEVVVARDAGSGEAA